MLWMEQSCTIKIWLLRKYSMIYAPCSSMPRSFRMSEVSPFRAYSSGTTLDHSNFLEQVNGLICLHVSNTCRMSSTLWPVGCISLQKGKPDCITGCAGARGGSLITQRRFQCEPIGWLHSNKPLPRIAPASTVLTLWLGPLHPWQSIGDNANFTLGATWGGSKNGVPWKNAQHYVDSWVTPPN